MFSQNSTQISIGFFIDLLTPVIFCLIVTLILPRMKTRTATVFAVTLLAVYWMTLRMGSQNPGIGFETVLSLAVLIGGYGIVMFQRILAEKRKARQVLSDPSGSDRTLGLFYRQQGLLDLAFEKYQSLPQDDDTKELILELAEEYERLGQMEKAFEAYKLVAGQGRDKKGVLPVTGLETKNPEPTSSPEAPIETRLNTSSRTEIGSTVAGYVVSEEVTTNAFGGTFRAKDPKTGISVTIKTWSCDRGKEREMEDIASRFLSTMECLRQLEHPNLLPPDEFGREGNLLYAVTKEPDGQDISRFIQKGRLLPVREVLRIVGQVASALQCAHDKKIVHQYLRPASVLIEKPSLTVRVRNFEDTWLAPLDRVAGADHVGLHLYLSPEEVSGKRVDGRSDIFSLGVIFFEMLTGATPFPGEDMASSMLKISKEKHPSPRFFNPKIPRVVETILDRALEKGPEKRYQKAGQMASHLNQVVLKIEELLQKRSK